MQITLTQPQKEYIAGMLAGFLDQIDMPLSANHPLAVQTALFEALGDMHKSWERIGWPQRNMLQIAAAHGVKMVYDRFADQIAAAANKFLDKRK